MAEAYCCPFCNSLFPRDQAQASPRGPCCPRCGEPLPALALAAATAGASLRQVNSGAPPPPAPLDSAVPTRRSRKANLIVGAVVFAVMAAMAVIGLTLALWTKDDRRRNDYKSPPGEWAGMGYLPVDCNLVLRIQVSELQKECEAKKLLDEPRPAYVDFVFTQLEKWTGLKLDMIDYVILGAVVEGTQQASLVVATHKPYSPAELVKNLRAAQIGEHHNVPVYSFQGGLARLWCREPNIFVIAVRPEEFKKGSHDEFPFPPRDGLRGQRQQLQLALASRLQKDSLAWIAGDGDWKTLWKTMTQLESMGRQILGKKAPAEASKDLQKLATIKTFVLSLDRDLVLHGSLFAGDKETLQWLTNYLDSMSKSDVKLKVVVPPADVVTGPEAFWVQVQAKFAAEQLRKTLNELGKKDAR